MPVTFYDAHFLFIMWKTPYFITARNEVGARLCFYTCVWFCSQGVGSGPGGWSGAGEGGSGPGGLVLVGGARPTPKGEIEGIRSRPTPKEKLKEIRSRPTIKGKLRGIRCRPTPKGGIEGDQVQAHTKGRNWGGSGTPDSYCCGRYASYWNAFFLFPFIHKNFLSEEFFLYNLFVRKEV